VAQNTAKVSSHMCQQMLKMKAQTVM